MTDLLYVVTTTDRREDAERIAAALIERRLSACCQVQGPIHSTYRWQGRVEQADQWLLTAKTSRDRFEALSEAIRELHTDQVPEIIALPIAAGVESYLDWLREQVRS